MRFPTVTTILTLSISAIATAQLTFNVTQAFAPGNWEKYHCLQVPFTLPLEIATINLNQGQRQTQYLAALMSPELPSKSQRCGRMRAR